MKGIKKKLIILFYFKNNLEIQKKLIFMWFIIYLNAEVKFLIC